MLLLPEGLLLGVRRGIRGIEALLPQGLQGFGLLPLPLPQEIQAAVGRHPVDPGFEGAFKMEGAQAPPDPDHGFLTAVGGVLPAAGIVPADPPDQGFHLSHQGFKGFRISPLRAL